MLIVTLNISRISAYSPDASALFLSLSRSRRSIGYNPFANNETPKLCADSASIKRLKTGAKNSNVLNSTSEANGESAARSDPYPMDANKDNAPIVFSREEEEDEED